MQQHWILLVVIVAFYASPTLGFRKIWNKFKTPHHFHDCGSSEKDWNNQPDSKWNGNNNNDAWVFPDEKPRPPWPRPRPSIKPTPAPQPTPTTWPTPDPTSLPTPIPTLGPNPGPRTTRAPRTPEEIQNCQSYCPVTPEYNPVCGTNGVTYNNLGRLECAKYCGVDVQLARSSRCPVNGVITTTSSPTTAARPNVQECISRCPVTPEYNPVCGSDGVTYTNPGRLECAKICGVNVQLSRNSRCPANQPVTSTVTPSVTTPADNGGSTIPKDILDQIFTTTPEPDTTGLIDERYE